MINAEYGVAVQATPTVPVVILGQDIDRSLVRMLTPGDSVLVEINGCLVYTSQNNPLTVEEPWCVVENSETELSLRHPSVPDHLLRLSYTELLSGPESQTAVWVTDDAFLSSNRLTVILQFVAFRTTSHLAAEILKPSFGIEGFEEVLSDPIAKRAVLHKIRRNLGGLKVAGWRYNSVARFALRSGVKRSIINSFRLNDPSYQGCSDDTVMRILRSMRWLAPYRIQSDEVQVDSRTTDEIA